MTLIEEIIARAARINKRLASVILANLVIGVGMLVGAWFALGHVSGEAVVDLAFLGERGRSGSDRDGRSCEQ